MLSIKEQRIRNITHLYYSRKDIQQTLFDFSQNKEISPRYFEGFGKRPDSFQYIGDIFELVKKGATSFHCSEELWEDPLQISTDMTPDQYNQQRIGWDLLLDIDSKYIDYSKIMVGLIIKFLNFHGIKNIGIKFSGSKGFHLIVPWRAFPKEVYGVKTSDMFPEWPRILLQYINEKISSQLVKEITNLTTVNKYIRDFKASKEVIPDLVLVSPRHLFRMPYSLHEKTALASVVLAPEEVGDFNLKDADPMKAKVRNFLPDSREGEASELLMSALDWAKENHIGEERQEKASGKYATFKNLELKNITDEQFPPCVKKIFTGLSDGRKRSLLVLINIFRSVGLDKEKLEKDIYDWNKKNKPPLKIGYIQSQLQSSYRKKPIPPPNCKEFYKGIGICNPGDLCKLIKNPLNYVVRRNLLINKPKRRKRQENSNKFKNIS